MSVKRKGQMGDEKLYDSRKHFRSELLRQINEGHKYIAPRRPDPPAYQSPEQAKKRKATSMTSENTGEQQYASNLAGCAYTPAYRRINRRVAMQLVDEDAQQATHAPMPAA